MSISKGSSKKGAAEAGSAGTGAGSVKKPQYVKPPNPKPMARRSAQAAPTALPNNGLRTAQPRGLLLANNLPALQNLVKREPHAYIDDFRAQWNHFNALAAVLTSSSTSAPAAAAGGAGAGSSEGGAGKVPCPLSTEDQHKFTALLSFVTQLSPSFPKHTASLPNTISELILHHHAALPHDIRRALLRSLILLRNRNAISSETLLRTLFPLLTLTTSSELRTSIQSTILQDIKTANASSKNHRLNGLVQGILFTIVDDQSSTGALAAQSRGQRAQPKTKSEALWAVRLAAQLWRKNIWNDAKTVSLLSLACFHHHPKVQSSAIRFFLGDLHSSESGNNDDSDADGSDDETDAVLNGNRASSVSALMHKRKVNKKTRANDRKVRLASAASKRKARSKEAEKEEHGSGSLAESGNLAALHLLHDPQSFGEMLFKELVRGDRGGKGTSSGHHPIEMKVRIMQLLSRVMSAHKLCILGFYGYVVKYLNPHQQFITLILVSLAQSVHTQTPPTVLLSLVRKLADNFVHPGVSAQVNAAGINSIREICRRQPSVMEEHDDGAEEGEDADGLRGDDLDNVDADGNRIDIPTGPSVATSNKAKQAAAAADKGEPTTIPNATVSHTLTHGPTLLADLVSYRKSKDKGVAAASRGLMQLYREVNPALLKRRERGKSGALAMADGGAGASGRKFGFGADDPDTVHGIQGIELLEKHLEQQRAEAEGDEDEDEDDEAGWEGFELESLGDSDEESEGWIDVSSGDENDVLNFSDSELGSSDDEDDDEEREKRRQAKAAKQSGTADAEEGKPKISARQSVKERRERRREERQKKRRKLSRANSTETGAEPASDDEKDSTAEATDSEDDAAAELQVATGPSKGAAAEQVDAFSKLATTRILTPADFAKLAELRLAAAEEAAKTGGLTGAAARRQVKELQAAAKAHRRAGSSAAQNGVGNDAVGGDAILSESDILGPQKKVKADYEERLASIAQGREGREKFGSKKGTKKREKGASSTNSEKKKGKNFAMIAHSWSVRSKKKASLREKSKRLRLHIDKAKKAYK
ncbi:Severe Depolymerization of Actin [Tilletia horrida]|nr:Severe Depolymerization of Actin [Tilletia horrida]